MKGKILFTIGFILVVLGACLTGAFVASFIGVIAISPEEMYAKVYPSVLIIVGGMLSLVAVALMTITGETMTCSVCGKEVDALIGRVNDSESKVCTDCYVSEKEGLKKGEQ